MELTLKLTVAIAFVGAVYWGPHEDAVNKAAEDMHQPEYWNYNQDQGIAPLRQALLKKITEQNGLHGVRNPLFPSTESLLRFFLLADAFGRN